MQDTVTIETGITCNNRCVFCYQLRYRGQGRFDVRTDLSFEEIVQRMKFARDRGFVSCHLTGGEPTIRKDFFRLLRAAGEAGFQHCGVTTNGRMFSSLPFALKAVKMGLDHASVSIQSVETRVHDGLSGVKSALAQTLAGIANLQKAASLLHRPMDIDTMTIIMQPNCQGLKALFGQLGSLGVRLFGIQPMITNQYNRHLMSGLYCTYSEIRDAVIPILPLLDDLDARIRLFNLPPCLFSDYLKYFELSYKGFTIPEYRDSAVTALGAGVSSQFFKTMACSDCTFPCPGLRMEEYPQQVMLDGLLAQNPQENNILTNIDLITESGLDTLLKTLESQGRRPLILFAPGEMRITSHAMARLISAHSPRAIIRYRPCRPRMEDNRLIEEGNENEVLDIVTRVHGKSPVYLGIELGGLDFARPESFRVLLQSVGLLSKQDGLAFVLGPDVGGLNKDKAVLLQRLREISSKSQAGLPFLVIDIGEDHDRTYLSLLRDVFGAGIKPDDLKEIKAHGFQRT